MNFSKFLPVLPVILLVSACVQPEPAPEPIQPEPVFDKWGNDVSPDGIQRPPRTPGTTRIPGTNIPQDGGGDGGGGRGGTSGGNGAS